MRIRGTAARWGTSVVTSALIATLLVLTSGPSSVQLAPAATNISLCSGYSGCIDAGYSDAGYGAVSSRMYWNMYSGHNCTNYVAYRMIKAGGPATRPWSGSGNASEWGLRLASVTDQTPNVGAVAWWGRYQNGHGSAGHVAYVERVISPTEIIISEDSWGGTFHWRRLSKDSGRWPSGFVHIADKQVKVAAAPTVSGTPTVGNTLTAGTGRWSVSPSALTYSWLVGGAATGVTTRTFAVRPADLGKPVTVQVRAKRAGYSDGVANSAATKAVGPGAFTIAAPAVVSGAPMVDETLTASAGSWKPTPAIMGWRWFADGVRVVGNDGPKLALTKAFIGKKITVAPVARATGYTTTAAPAVTVGTVLQGTIEVTTPLRITGSPLVGQPLAVAGATTNPAGVTRSVQWLRDGVPIAGATGPTYRLVGADAGQRIGVQVNLTARNYAPASETAALPTYVTSPARISIATAARGGMVYARVQVQATGVIPRGDVLVRIGGTTQKVRLVDGRVRVSVPAGVTGRREVAVRYLGSTAVPAARATSSVVVR